MNNSNDNKRFAQNQASKKNNVQVYPSKTIFFPNDRFSKKIATFSPEMFQDMNEGDSKNLIEIKNHKKFGKILSPFRIFVDEQSSITLSEPVEQFDFAVLCVAISEYYVGNRFITPSIIYRALTGKVNDNDANPSKVQLASILHSVEKLMFLKTQINMSDYCQKLNCNDGKAFEVLSPLLPAKKISETTINGKESTIIELTSESPLWQIACLKNQLMSFDAALLNVPNQNNSKMNIELKNYVLRRIVEVKKHRQLTPTITFDDLFSKCRLENSDKGKKRDARNAVIDFLEHLKNEKFIKDFEPVKHGNSFYSVSFKK